jgi:hypothetical protein
LSVIGRCPSVGFALAGPSVAASLVIAGWLVTVAGCWLVVGQFVSLHCSSLVGFGWLAGCLSLVVIAIGCQFARFPLSLLSLLRQFAGCWFGCWSGCFACHGLPLVARQFAVAGLLVSSSVAVVARLPSLLSCCRLLVAGSHCRRHAAVIGFVGWFVTVTGCFGSAGWFGCQFARCRFGLARLLARCTGWLRCLLRCRRRLGLLVGLFAGWLLPFVACLLVAVVTARFACRRRFAARRLLLASLPCRCSVVVVAVTGCHCHCLHGCRLLLRLLLVAVWLLVGLLSSLLVVVAAGCLFRLLFRCRLLLLRFVGWFIGSVCRCCRLVVSLLLLFVVGLVCFAVWLLGQFVAVVCWLSLLVVVSLLVTGCCWRFAFSLLRRLLVGLPSHTRRSVGLVSLGLVIIPSLPFRFACRLLGCHCCQVVGWLAVVGWLLSLLVCRLSFAVCRFAHCLLPSSFAVVVNCQFHSVVAGLLGCWLLSLLVSVARQLLPSVRVSLLAGCCHCRLLLGYWLRCCCLLSLSLPFCCCRLSFFRWLVLPLLLLLLVFVAVGCFAVIVAVVVCCSLLLWSVIAIVGRHCRLLRIVISLLLFGCQLVAWLPFSAVGLLVAGFGFS